MEPRVGVGDRAAVLGNAMLGNAMLGTVLLGDVLVNDMMIGKTVVGTDAQSVVQVLQVRAEVEILKSEHESTVDVTLG